MGETLERIRRELQEARDGHVVAADAQRLAALEALGRQDYSAAATACHRAHQHQLQERQLNRWVQ